MRPATPPSEFAKDNLLLGDDRGHLSEETESSGNDKSDDDKPGKGSYSVEDARRFLTGGSPFEQYKLRLQRFVHPTLTATPSQVFRKEGHASTSSDFSNRADELLTQPKRLVVSELTREMVARALLVLLWIAVPFEATFVRRGYNVKNSAGLLDFTVNYLCKNWLGVSPLGPQVVRIVWICVSSRDQYQRCTLINIEMWIYVLRRHY
jgi:hypothetical protein